MIAVSEQARLLEGFVTVLTRYSGETLLPHRRLRRHGENGPVLSNTWQQAILRT